MGSDTSPPKDDESRLDYLTRLLKSVGESREPGLAFGAPDVKIFDRSLRRQAQNVLNHATPQPGKNEDVNKAFARIAALGLEAFYGENGREITALMHKNPDAATAITLTYKNALGEATKSAAQEAAMGILEGMRKRAEALEIRPSWENPACHLEGSDGLPPGSPACTPPSAKNDIVQR